MSKNALMFLVIGIVVVGGIIWVTSNKPEAQSPAAVVENGGTTANQPATAEGIDVSGGNGPEDKTEAEKEAGSAEASKTIKVDAKNFSFSPTKITVKKGESVKIQLVNAEGFHDFVIDEFNVKTEKIGANQTAEVTFTPDKTGSFEYYCSVGSHRQMGMKGILTVEE